MHSYRARITPRSAFGTTPKGDTLFGQLCWAVRNRHGEDRLTSLLDGYTAGRPFAVVSDAFPADYLPRPMLPIHRFDEVASEVRKTVKKRAWLPLEQFKKPITGWLTHSRLSADIPGARPDEHPQPHNTLNRETGTTGTGQFAPYAMPQLWYGRKKDEIQEVCEQVLLDLYIVLDEERMKPEELQSLLSFIGEIGFGRDASVGLGKFEVKSFEPFELPAQDDANAWMTLAPCAPQGLAWDGAHCFYQPFTRLAGTAISARFRASLSRRPCCWRILVQC